MLLKHDRELWPGFPEYLAGFPCHRLNQVAFRCGVISEDLCFPTAHLLPWVWVALALPPDLLRLLAFILDSSIVKHCQQTVGRVCRRLEEKKSYFYITLLCSLGGWGADNNPCHDWRILLNRKTTLSNLRVWFFCELFSSAEMAFQNVLPEFFFLNTVMSARACSFSGPTLKSLTYTPGLPCSSFHCEARWAGVY